MLERPRYADVCGISSGTTAGSGPMTTGGSGVGGTPNFIMGLPRHRAVTATAICNQVPSAPAKSKTARAHLSTCISSSTRQGR